MSGHTKLLRYIAYVFPGIMILLAILLTSFHNKSNYIKRVNKVTIGFWVFFILLLIQQSIQFYAQTSENMLFTATIFFLILSLLGLFHWGVVSKSQPLIHSPIRWLFYVSIIYIVSFSSIAFQYHSTDFLNV